MNVAVVDTSALVRLYIPDGPIPSGLELILDEAWHGNALLVTPELALAELGQVLRKKEDAKTLSAKEADEIMASVLGLPVQWIGHVELIEDAVRWSRKGGLTVYDGLFLALAIGRNAQLFSADKALMSAHRRALG